MEDLKEERERANKGLSFDEESSLAAFASISLRRDRGRRYYWDLGFLSRQGRQDRRVCFVWGNCKRVGLIIGEIANFGDKIKNIAYDLILLYFIAFCSFSFGFFFSLN